MMQKIYFNYKPLFICSEITPTIDDYLHRGTTILLDEFSTNAVKTIIEEMERPEINAGVFLHANEEEVLNAIKEHMTVVQAAGGFVHVQGEQVLLIFRRGKWDLPKGKLDKGEDLATCATREVEEETGVSGLRTGDLLTVTYHTYHERERFILKETYWYLMEADTAQPFTPQEEEDIEKCEWVKTGNLAPYLDNTYPTIVEVAKAGTETLKASKRA
ncbi:MAG TPA: NUDIX domain-containing protein [Chitinophagaceae bacterium]